MLKKLFKACMVVITFCFVAGLLAVDFCFLFIKGLYSICKETISRSNKRVTLSSRELDK